MTEAVTINGSASDTGALKTGGPPVSFSILFYTDVREEVSDQEKLDFLKESTIFADKAGFTSVYMPERHFHNRGCLYPAPAVLAAWLAPQTTRIRFRTAGLALPLHHPATIAEAWAVVDCVSGGRVDLGIGNGGGHVPLYTLAPDAYARRKAITSERIHILQKLWRGESVTFPGPGGKDFPIASFPRPVQKEITIWLLVVENEEAFAYAGAQGYNIMTMLYGTDLQGLEKKIARYRKARAETGRDPESGVVSIMLHTLVIDDQELMHRQLDATFKPFVEKLTGKLYAMANNGRRIEQLSPGEQAETLGASYAKHLGECGIFGRVPEARKMVDKALAAGVNDIAFLIDYGVDYGVMRECLPNLRELAALYS